MSNINSTLKKNPANPRYFTDDTGKGIYLTGSHTWANLQEIKLEGDPDFNYDEFLDLLESHNHNFMRMWEWIHPEKAPWTTDRIIFDPLPFARTGTGIAGDGKPKFNLDQWNEAYFERMRDRVIKAGERGIYVSVMFFEGYCVRWAKPNSVSDPWVSHPFNIKNNVNGVHGDSNNDGKADIFSLDTPDVLKYQKAFIRKVVDTVNDLDNVLYEIANEAPNDQRALDWHYHIIDYVHEYEKTKPKQHPVGMTAEGGGQDNSLLFPSPADWISPGHGKNNEYRDNPPIADGSKVIILDTDHLWGHGGHYKWAWKSFLRGHNPIFMDPWQPIPGSDYSNKVNNIRDYPDWEPLRVNLGYTRQFAQRINLNSMLPHNELASTEYCLADPGKEYLVYLPDGGQVKVDLSYANSKFNVEWFNPTAGETKFSDSIDGGKTQELKSPFASDTVLYIPIK